MKNLDSSRKELTESIKSLASRCFFLLRRGILHGDANISNFHWDDSTETLEVFDFDQAQQGWWVADLAQASRQ